MPLPLRWLVLIALVVLVPLFIGYSAVAAFEGARAMALPVGIGAAVLFTVLTAVSASMLPATLIKYHEAKRLSGNQYQNQIRTLAMHAERLGVPNPSVYVISDGAPHAFAAGMGPSKTLFITRGLFDSLDPDEFQAYLDYLLVASKRGDITLMTFGAGAAAVCLLPLRIADIADNDVLRVLLTVIFGWFGALYIHAIGARSEAYTLDALAGKSHGVGGHLALAAALNNGQRTLLKHPMDKIFYAASPLYVVNPLGAKGVAGIFVTHAPTPKRVKRLQRQGTRAVGKEAIAKSKGLV